MTLAEASKLLRRSALDGRLHAERDLSCRAQIVHDAVPGRVRLRHLGLVARADRAQVVHEALLRRPGVVSAHVDLLTGSVLVRYGLPATVADFVAVIDAAAAGRRPPLSRRRQPAHELSAAASTAEAIDLAQSWHAIPIHEVAAALDARPIDGLSADESARRMTVYGPNELRRAEARSPAAIFLEQLTSLPIVLLGASACLSLLTGGLADAAMIAAVVVVNACIATATERQAERTILGLSNHAPQPVPVMRGGVRGVVLPSELAPGDLILLERGALVPADGRLIASDELMVNESALTGEALPAQKDAAILLPPDASLADRCNMVFRGTAVTGGSGAALVTAIGVTTEIGRVQQLLGAVSPPETPIQRQLGAVERELIIVNGLICGAVFGLGLLRGHGLVPMLRSAISLAVAAIPEGLPAVATTTLALGIQDMGRRNVVVRKLDAVETLGAVEVIGLDKTGTLTENHMSTVAVHADGALFALESGRLIYDGQDAAPAARLVASRLFEVAALCSEAIVRPTSDGFSVEGTPTESALAEAALALGVDVVTLRLSARLRMTAPRGDGRKRMSTLHETTNGDCLLCVKGDPLEVLTRCSTRLTAEGVAPLDEEARAAVLRANEHMAGQALRVLGVALAETGCDPHDESDLVWLGLAGLANPIRPSVAPALERLHGANIRTVMITGDQTATAFAIARNLKLGNGDELKVLEAGQITGLQPDVLRALVAQPQVFARVSPVDKLNIVKALQANGHVVAMTGDGINDGPALRAADIGIAMGRDGADVAREVADIVLASDDLDGVIEAIRLGRATYANIRKVLRYLVSTNASETFVMLGAAIAGGEPLTPMQLLWLNLATDALPALALGLEPPEADVLRQSPHDPRAPILMSSDFHRILREGSVMGSAALAGYLFFGAAAGGMRASTVTFHGLTLTQLLYGISSRSETRGFAAEFHRPPSPKLYGAIAASTVLQIVAQLFPGARRLLGLAPIGPAELLGIAGIVCGATIANDLIGLVLRDDGPPSRPPEQ